MISESIVNIAFDWFGKYAQTEKNEIETLFSQLTRYENIEIRKNLANIFTLDEDKWDMLDILDGVDILQNVVKIALRSIPNGNNLESHIVKNIQFDKAKYPFLIVKNHLILYGIIEKRKNDPFFIDSPYKDIYNFCKIFSVDSKLSVLLRNNLNLDDMDDWLNFDDKSNQAILYTLENLGIHTFADVCLICRDDDGFKSVLEKIKNDDDKRLEFKLRQLRQTIRLFERKWSKLIKF